MAVDDSIPDEVKSKAPRQVTMRVDIEADREQWGKDWIQRYR